MSSPASCGWWRPGTHLGQADVGVQCVGVFGVQRAKCGLGVETDVWWQGGSLVPALFFSQAARELRVLSLAE